MTRAHAALADLGDRVKLCTFGLPTSPSALDTISHAVLLGFIAGPADALLAWCDEFDLQDARARATGHAPHDETIAEHVVRARPELHDLHRVHDWRTMFTDY
jgi:hypothetical protein